MKLYIIVCSWSTPDFPEWLITKKTKQKKIHFYLTIGLHTAVDCEYIQLYFFKVTLDTSSDVLKVYSNTWDALKNANSPEKKQKQMGLFLRCIKKEKFDLINVS